MQQDAVFPDMNPELWNRSNLYQDLKLSGRKVLLKTKYSRTMQLLIIDKAAVLNTVAHSFINKLNNRQQEVIINFKILHEEEYRL